MRLDHSVVVVTGASGGVGRATAARFANRGAQLVLVGPDRRALQHSAASSGARLLVADLAEPGEPERVASEAIRTMGRVDVLVNNGEQGWSGRSPSLDDDDLEWLVSVNLLAPLRLTRALLPVMLDGGRGRIVNVTSVAGQTAGPGAAAHAATKAGLVAFTQSLSEELAGTGVSAGLVTPSAVNTTLLAQFLPRRFSVTARSSSRQLPPGRVADAITRAVAERQQDALLPTLMNVPARLRGAIPVWYRSVTARFG